MNRLINAVLVIGVAYLVWLLLQQQKIVPPINITAKANRFIEKWIQTVGTHNADAITNLYSDDAVLLGTVAEQINQGRGAINWYFKEFVLKRPKAKLDKIIIKRSGLNGYVADGDYTFTLTDGRGEVQMVPARFTFVLRPTLEGFKITTHHSSEVPTM